MKNEDLLKFGGFGSGMFMGIGLFCLVLSLFINVPPLLSLSLLTIVASLVFYMYVKKWFENEKR